MEGTALKLLRGLSFERLSPSRGGNAAMADTYIDTLCEQHGVKKADVVRALAKVLTSQGKVSGEDLRIIEILSHETFLDIPVNKAGGAFGPSVFAWSIAFLYRTEIEREFRDLELRAMDKEMPYMLRTNSRRTQRELLAGLNLVDFPGDMDLLQELRRRLIIDRLQLASKDTQITVEHSQFNIDIGARIAALGNDVLNRWVKQTYQAHAQIDRNHMRDVMQVSVTTINELFDASVLLRDLTRAAGSSDIVPSHIVYDNVQRATAASFDPLLYVWTKKITDRQSGRPVLSLRDYWNARPATIPSPNSAGFANILERIEQAQIPVYTMAQFANRLGGADSERTVKNFCTNEERQRKAWVISGTAYEPVAGSLLARMATLLGCAPEQLVAPPKPPTQILASAATVVTQPVIAKPFNGAYAQGAALNGLIEKVLGLHKLQGAAATHAKTILTHAFKNPHQAAVDGVPSLPHLWLMWAHNPDSAKASAPSEILTHLTDTYALAVKVDGSAQLGKTAYGTFVLAIINSGADKILAGADAPWASPLNHAQFLMDIGFKRKTDKGDFIDVQQGDSPADITRAMNEFKAFFERVEKAGKVPDKVDLQAAIDKSDGKLVRSVRRDIEMVGYVQKAAQMLRVQPFVLLGPSVAGQRLATAIRPALAI